MQLHTCLALSKYDLNTGFYFLLVFALCLAFNLYIHLFDCGVIEMTFSYAMLVVTLFSCFMYILGFLSGIVVARTTVMENLESLTEIKLDPAVKPGAVGSITPPLSII
jgi:hypothetical protein